MRIPISIPYKDIAEITYFAFRAFIGTYSINSEHNGVDDLGSDSESSTDYDPAPYECNEINELAEDFVQHFSSDCKPLENVYGETASDLIKTTIRSANQEADCVGLKVFAEITPGEDRNLIHTCALVVHYCCCETVKKISPIIASATINLID